MVITHTVRLLSFWMRCCRLVGRHQHLTTCFSELLWGCGSRLVPVYCEDDTVAWYLTVPVYPPTQWLIMFLKPTKMSQTKLWFMWDKDTLYPTKHHTSQCTSKQRHSYTQARWRWVVIFIPTTLPLGKSLQYSSCKTQNQYEWCRIEANLLPVAQPAFNFAHGPVHKTALSRLQCFSSKLKK